MAMSVDAAGPRQVTVQDVADRAGVSKATAARVLGGYGLTSKAVKDKVAAAARALDYRANELARSMTTGRSRTLGVVVGDVENPYFGQAVRGISDFARQAGFGVLLANSGEDIQAERDAVRVLLGKRVEGLIITPSHMFDARHLEDVAKSRRPLVLMDRYVPGLPVDAVVADDRAASASATALLISAGHRRIGYLSATAADDPVFQGLHQIRLSTVLNRIEGFLETGRDAGISGLERYIRLGVRRSGIANEIVAALMLDPDRPTALIASDNVVALEVFRALKGLGLLIPRDVSLIAFHDADWTSLTDPTITVVAQPSYELGVESAKAVLAQLNQPSRTPQRTVLSTMFIIRNSIAEPPRI